MLDNFLKIKAERISTIAFIFLSALWALFLLSGSYDIFIYKGDYLHRPDIDRWLSKIGTLITDQSFSSANGFIVTKPYYWWLKLFSFLPPKFTFAIGHALPLFTIAFIGAQKAAELFLHSRTKSALVALVYAGSPVAQYLILIPEPFGITYATFPLLLYNSLVCLSKGGVSSFLGFGLISQIVSWGFVNPTFMFISQIYIGMIVLYTLAKKETTLSRGIALLAVWLVCQLPNNFYALGIVLSIFADFSSQGLFQSINEVSVSNAYSAYSLLFFKQDFDLYNIKLTEAIALLAFIPFYLLVGSRLDLSKLASPVAIFVLLLLCARGVHYLFDSSIIFFINNIVINSIRSPDKIIHFFNFAFLIFLFSSMRDDLITQRLVIIVSIYFAICMSLYNRTFVNESAYVVEGQMSKKIKLDSGIESINKDIQKLDPGRDFRIATFPTSEHLGYFRLFPKSGIFGTDPYLYLLDNSVIDLTVPLYFNQKIFLKKEDNFQRLHEILLRNNVKFILFYRDSMKKDVERFEELLSNRKHYRHIKDVNDFSLYSMVDEPKRLFFVPQNYGQFIDKAHYLDTAPDVFTYPLSSSERLLREEFSTKKQSSFVVSSVDKSKNDMLTIALRTLDDSGSPAGSLFLASSLKFNSLWTITRGANSQLLNCGGLICIRIHGPIPSEIELRASILRPFEVFFNGGEH